MRGEDRQTRSSHILHLEYIRKVTKYVVGGLGEFSKTTGVNKNAQLGYIVFIFINSIKTHEQNQL